MLQIAMDLTRGSQPAQMSPHHCSRVQFIGVLASEVQRFAYGLRQLRVVTSTCAHLVRLRTLTSQIRERAAEALGAACRVTFTCTNE